MPQRNVKTGIFETVRPKSDRKTFIFFSRWGPIATQNLLFYRPKHAQSACNWASIAAQKQPEKSAEKIKQLTIRKLQKHRNLALFAAEGIPFQNNRFWRQKNGSVQCKRVRLIGCFMHGKKKKKSGEITVSPLLTSMYILLNFRKLSFVRFKVVRPLCSQV